MTWVRFAQVRPIRQKMISENGSIFSNQCRMENKSKRSIEKPPKNINVLQEVHEDN
jgi:hypothetical protein